jgi:hypothetical protein
MGSMWVRGERRYWSSRARSRDHPRRRRRGAGASDALGASAGGRGDRGADRISRGPFGRLTAKDGAGTGTAACEPGPARRSTRRRPWMGSGGQACEPLSMTWSRGGGTSSTPSTRRRRRSRSGGLGRAARALDYFDYNSL